VLADRSEDKLNVHLVCHSHHDPGWLKTYDQGFLGTRNDYHVRLCSLFECSCADSAPLLIVAQHVIIGLTTSWASNSQDMDLQAHVGPHVSAVQYELDGIMHGLMANPDRKFVYCEMVLSDKCIAV